MPFRRTFFVVAALMLTAALGYTGYWFHVAGQLRKGLERWADERRGEGWRIGWADLSVGGYPGRVTARMTAPALTTKTGTHWDGETLSASANPFDLSRMHLSFPGRHRLALGGTDAVATATGAEGELDLDRSGELELGSAILSGLSVAIAGQKPFTAAMVALVLDPLPVAQPGHDTATIAFSVTAQDMTLPPLPGLVLDRNMAAAEISGHVKGRMEPGPLPLALAQWSIAGGTVDIDRLALDWAPMGMEADGTLAFDPDLQPLAALSARVRGFAPLMDRLAQAGAVDAGAASAAKLLLSMMAKPDQHGRPSIPVPVTLQDGTLYLGPAKVAQVPPIVWPDR